jgi:flavin-binding protein dodecin
MQLPRRGNRDVTDDFARKCDRLTRKLNFDKNSQLIAPIERKIMAGKGKDSIYKVVEVVGTSTKSWADAGRRAVEAAGGTLRDLRIAEVVKLDMAIENGKVRAYRARVSLSFKYGS